MRNHDEFATYLEHNASAVRYQDTFSPPLDGEKVFMWDRPFWTFVGYTPERGPVKYYTHGLTGDPIEQQVFPFWEHGEKYRRESPGLHKKWAFVTPK